jgi:hypothetical protein
LPARGPLAEIGWTARVARVEIDPSGGQRVKFFKSLFLMVALCGVIMAAGCSKKAEELEAVKGDRDQVLTTAAASGDKLMASTEGLQKENARLKTDLQNLLNRLENNDKQLEDLKFEVRRLQETVTGVKARVTAAEAEKPSGGIFWTFLWIIIIVIVIALLIYLIYSFLKPKAFEEDDDDLSEFEDDFGFDEEDDEEFFEGDEKKDGEGEDKK